MDVEGKTIAITGAGGFVGLHMVQRCRERGMIVRGLDSSAGAVEAARNAGAEMIQGDVCDPEDAKRLCSGADIVFHAAAIVHEGGDYVVFEKINVGGTRTMAAAASAAGVKRFIQVSSVMVYGFHYPDNITEDGPLCGEDNSYCQTKIESEHAAIGFHRPGAMEVIVIRCGDIYGPRSNPWTVRPIEMMRQNLFIYANGGRGIMNHVYIDNMLDAVFLALAKNVTGESFNITDGQRTTFKEFFGNYAGMLGKRWLPSLPAGPLKLLIAMSNVVRKLFRQPIFITAEFIPYVTRVHCYSIEKSRRMLGYEPRVALEEGMRRIAYWLKTQPSGTGK